ncbi:hypothetical protein IGI04_034894, partial [Brassica rapa subsp. trilocularis]
APKWHEIYVRSQQHTSQQLARHTQHETSEPKRKTEPTNGCHHHMSSCFGRWLSTTSLSEAAQAGSFSRHHSLTNTQANNLLGTHYLNMRLRVGNSSTRVYKNSSLTRHEFTETLLLLGTSSQDRLHLSLRTWGDLLLGVDLHPTSSPLDNKLDPFYYEALASSLYK